MTNKLIKIALCWTSSAAIIYLAGAFMAASFDITIWDEFGRAMAGLGWLAFAAAAVPAILVGEDFI